MIDYQAIIDYYYPEAEVPELREILLKHSRAVAEKAVKIVDAHPELHCDRDFVYAAAMLHDIGIIRCDAPGIHCYGTEPYIRHGVEGMTLLTSLEGRNPDQKTRESGTYNPKFPFEGELEDFARVCARHTGTGLPGLEPETWEEKIICYADKFFSKTKLDREKTYEEARQSLLKFGEEGVRKFEEWHRQFELTN